MKKKVRFKTILNLLFYCVNMDFCSYKLGNVRIKVIKKERYRIDILKYFQKQKKNAKGCNPKRKYSLIFPKRVDDVPTVRPSFEDIIL